MFKSKKVIVSGATGFIGQHLIPILLKDGYEVLAISRNRKRAEFLPWFKDVKFIYYDFHSHHNQSKIIFYENLCFYSEYNNNMHIY